MYTITTPLSSRCRTVYQFLLVWICVAVARGHRLTGARRSATTVKQVSSADQQYTTSDAPFYWLHIPKTGSSFATTIGATCCGNYTKTLWGQKNFSRWPCMDSCVIVNETHPFGSHSALGKKISANYRLIEDEPAFFSSYSVITNLRRPKARLQSGFFHSFHDCKSLQNELDIIEKGQMNLTDVALVKSIIANDTMLEATLHKYVDCVKGCSVKMVTGYSCGQNISNANGTVPKEVVARALRRVEKFAFVGFQEHWDESVRLFLERFGGSFTDDTLLNNRPRHSAFTEEEVEKVAVLLDQPQYQDEYDEALYQHAHDIHWKEEDVSILSNHRHQRQKRAAKHLLNEKPISSSHNLTQNLEPQ